jgi:hypothetical protein
VGEARGVHRVLVGKPEGKRPLWRHRRRWEGNIKMDLQKVGCGVMDRIDLAQDRDRWRALVNTLNGINMPSNTTNDVINVYLRTTVVSAFFYEAIIRSRFTKGWMFKTS